MARLGLDISLPGPSASEEDCAELLRSISGKDPLAPGDDCLPLTAGFANSVYAVSRQGEKLIVKCYTDLVFLRIAEDAIGVVDLCASAHRIGPRVMHSSTSGLVMEHLPGRTLEEADIQRNGNEQLLEGVAEALAQFHRLPVPEACKGEPMLWRTITKMLAVIQRRPELLPPQMPDLEAIVIEIEAARAALDKHALPVVLGHGDFKPSNVIEHEGSVRLIDFELGGPNYRGFDIMKLFRTNDSSWSESNLALFLRAYLAASGPSGGEQLQAMFKEVARFEALTWLEAAVFFLTLPQFKPCESSRWHSLAVHRWNKFQETKSTLF